MGSICVYKGLVGLDDLHDLRMDTENALKENGIDADSCANLVLIVDEWITNVISYAYQNKKGELELTVDFRDSKVTICIRDRGPKFDFTSYKAKQLDNIYETDSKPGGYGIELIRRLADKLEYTRSEDGWNENCFNKYL